MRKSAFHGQCHCRNLCAVFETARAPVDLALRCCQCSFCRKHGVRAVSDPDGHARIESADAEHVVRYRFGLHTADYLLCARCGAYVGAILHVAGGAWATLNANVFEPRLEGDGVAVRYEGESAAERVARRQRVWTPAEDLAGGMVFTALGEAQTPTESAVWLSASERLRLRRSTAADVDCAMELERDSENEPFVVQWTKARHHAALVDSDELHGILEAAADGRRVGFLTLAGLAGSDGSIEFRRLVIAEKGSGLGREAVQLVVRYAFRELAAHRLWLDVRDHNLRARRLYRSEGFVEEGILRECSRKGDRFDSMVVMSMLRREWEERDR